MLKISVRNSIVNFSPIGVSLNNPKSQLLIGGLQQRARGTLPKVPSGMLFVIWLGSKTNPSILGSCVLKAGATKLGLPGHSNPSVLPCNSVSLQLLIRI